MKLAKALQSLQGCFEAIGIPLEERSIQICKNNEHHQAALERS
jgi:hypothetical protein